MTVTITDTTAELLTAWREAQRVLDQLRLDAPGRTEAEQRVHDARMAYLDRVNELTEANAGA
jgi:hypothetical protein